MMDRMKKEMDMAETNYNKQATEQNTQLTQPKAKATNGQLAAVFDESDSTSTTEEVRANFYSKKMKL